MPCAHAIAAIAHRNLKAEDFCHAWLTLGAYNATYAYFVQPVQGVEFWEQTNYEKPVPPLIKRRPGRPKRARRKDGNEELVSNGKLRRTLAPVTCSRCGTRGHNRTTCPLPRDQPAQPQGDQPVQPQGDQPLQNQPETPHETQTEIDLSQSEPQSQPQSQGPNIADVNNLYFNMFISFHC